MLKRIIAPIFPWGVYVLLKNARILGFGFGQYRSAVTKTCVDAQGQPVPWYTYPAIEYIRQLDFSPKVIFEFGSGNSTLFWSRRCKNLVSVEDDPKWYREISKNLPPNTRYDLEQDKQNYVQSIHHHEQRYDVVIVDGSHRYDCAVEAVRKISGDAMIILDNSDWHGKTAEFLRRQNLIQVDMSGFGPINHYTWTTSFFLTRDFRFQPAADRQPVGGPGSLPGLDES
jgi:hypothetical protein